MKSLKTITFGLLILGLSACGNGSNNNSSPELDLLFSDAPVDLPGVSAQYAENVSYGPAERNLFDIFLPDCDDPTPLVIYVHGGGFTGGDKQGGVDAAAVGEYLQACIAYASINYTLLNIPGANDDIQSAVTQGGVLTSLQDTARALQFMRYHHKSLNLDIENVAMYGVSAGAGASLWLGTHDDMADPDNEDPVLRESTRIKAVGALATQATYDLVEWETVLLPVTQDLADLLGGTDVLTLAQAVGATNYLLTFLGVASVDDIFGADNIAYRSNIDMLSLMDSGDAPIWMRNFQTNLANPLDLFLHHGLHAVALKARADEVGLSSVAYVEEPAFAQQDPSGEELISFLIRHIR